MPIFIRRKLLEQPEERTVGDLCTLARRTLYLNQICEVDDWNANAFSEGSNVQSEDYLNVLAKITKTQSAMEDNNFIKKVDESLCLNAIQTNSRNYPRQDINRIAIEAINSARITNEAEDIIKTGRTRPIKTNPIDHDMDNGFTHPKIMMLVWRKDITKRKTSIRVTARLKIRKR